jgi:tetratricopeptide (TPR) repeat protein
LNPGDLKLSACMIAKDEEDNLPRALESLRGLADEIVLVDTGSTDRTREIALSFGANVIEHPWREDFAAAKNVALENARGRWILVLDADECVEPDSKEKVRAALSGKADAYYVRIESEMRSGAGRTFVNLHQRLFRNNLGIRYEGAIHEQVQTSLDRIGARVENSDIVLRHWGYALTREDTEAKLKRNLDMLLKVVDADPDDAVSFFHLAETHSLAGDHSAAIDCYEKALRIKRLPAAMVPVAMQNLASSKIKTGRYEEALRLLRHAQELAPELISIHLLAGSALFGMKKFERAEQEIMTYISKAGESARRPAPIFGFKPDIPAGMVLAARCRLARGETESAGKLLKEAVSADRDQRDGHVLLGRIAFEGMSFAKAASHFEKAVDLNPYDERAYFELARSYVAAGADGRAAESVEKALGLGIETAGLLRCLGLIKIRQREFEAAISAYEHALRLEPGNREALNRLAGLHHRLGRDEVARQYLTIRK